MQQTFRRVTCQFETALGDILHRPLLIVIASVCQSGQIGKQDGFTALTLIQSSFHLFSLSDILDQADILILMVIGQFEGAMTICTQASEPSGLMYRLSIE